MKSSISRMNRCICSRSWACSLLQALDCSRSATFNSISTRMAAPSLHNRWALSPWAARSCSTAGSANPTLMYVDTSMGYWVFDARDESRNSWLLGGYVSGIAPIVELHYTTNLQPISTHVAGITSEFAGEDILDMTAGLSFQLGPMSNLTVAGCVPLLTNLRDKDFDSEVIVEFDRHF